MPLLAQDITIKEPKGSLKPGFAFTFPWMGENLFYGSSKEATNEVIRLYKGYNCPIIKKVKVLKGRDKYGVYFILQEKI